MLTKVVGLWVCRYNRTWMWRCSDPSVSVVSSLIEGRLVFLRGARTCGVVATNVDGASDVSRLGARGALVSPNAPPALADAIESARLPEVQGPASAIRPRILNEFGVARLRGELADLYLTCRRRPPLPSDGRTRAAGDSRRLCVRW
jgi:glycosyltransferase involved in cell wall biosynthesis